VSSTPVSLTAGALPVHHAVGGRNGKATQNKRASTALHQMLNYTHALYVSHQRNLYIAKRAPLLSYLKGYVQGPYTN
jgi:hypothetical protein